MASKELTVHLADLPEMKALAAQLNATRFVLDVREKELLDVKGPCINGQCRLHLEHSGPCEVDANE